MNERSEIVAALGPTNTGKTYRATQRMQDFRSGMIGLPLRLLAREVYDGVVRAQGKAAVALVTGEEKRVPPRPAFWICTVEAMPLDVEVDFLAVDEVQLAGHRERGHVFTDRLLHARGRKETWFLGSDTMSSLVQKLVPTARLERYPRFSRLRGEGQHSLASLPPRSAVVAFSMNRVYELAERIKARKGGAAVVLGALSPRARNAQVAMYQAGEVDYLVATDAIGMGLNLAVDRVSFAETNKFDGVRSRELEVAELAQIAGRAGRHLNDGAFGTLAPRPPLSRDVERAIEQHRFVEQRAIFWRNSDLSFESLSALRESLRRPPWAGFLHSVQAAQDAETLEKLLRRSAVTDRASDAERIELLWEACQIPDYRKLLVDEHANLVESIYRRLVDHGRLQTPWLEEKLNGLLQHDGDIETIMSRIASCRTWNYVVGREGWVEDPRDWQKRTRRIEDSLSDALHGSLVERFVARKKRGFVPPVARSGARHDPIHRLSELKAELEADQPADERAEDPLQRLFEATESDFYVSVGGTIACRPRVPEAQPVAYLLRGQRLTEPNVRLSDDVREWASKRGTDPRSLEDRLHKWSRSLAPGLLGDLEQLRENGLSPPARGIVYQLQAGLGAVRNRDVREQWRLLDEQERKRLSRAKVSFGRRVCYVRSALGGSAIAKRSALVAAFHGSRLLEDESATSRVSLPVPESWRGQKQLREAALALGFFVVGSRLVRQDMMEKMLRELPKKPEQERLGLICSWCGCSKSEARQIHEALGLHRSAGRKRHRRRRRPASQNDT